MFTSLFLFSPLLCSFHDPKEPTTLNERTEVSYEEKRHTFVSPKSYGIFCQMDNAKNLVSTHNSVLIKVFKRSGNYFVLEFWFGKWNIIQSNNEGPTQSTSMKSSAQWLMMLMNSQSLIKDTKCYSNDLTQAIGNSIFLLWGVLYAFFQTAHFAKTHRRWHKDSELSFQI